LRNTGGAGTLALPAVFLLQRGMASSKLFIGGEFWHYFPLLQFLVFLLSDSVRFRALHISFFDLWKTRKRKKYFNWSSSFQDTVENGAPNA
jgi:hypothetical protein